MPGDSEEAVTVAVVWPLLLVTNTLIY